ncbi:hypothetical protein ACHAWO_008078 [Cyclotella atomus]|jgi:hypothetical protein|uniref:Uncharacterized protein n=1 Tax=Cyclotella atomus TaxID=382360 RepID=A0ABD3NRD7_9STRA
MSNNTNSSGGKGKYYTIKPAELLTLNKNPVAATDGDSPILMEARLTETINSINQLISSNAQLDEILQEARDPDLMEALEENDALILRKIEECTVLRRKLVEAGVQLSLEIPVYNGSKVLNQSKDRKDDGVYL